MAATLDHTLRLGAEKDALSSRKAISVALPGMSISEQVLSNPLIIGQIVSYLDLKSLCRAKRISRQWSIEAKRQIRKRKTFLDVSYVYTSRRANATEVNLLNQRGLAGHSKKDLIDHVQAQLRDHLWSQPKFGFMFHCGPKNLLYDSMKSVKDLLPPNCQILGLVSRNGFIPTVRNEQNNSLVSCEVQLRTHFGITCSLWPSLEGVEFTVFDENSTLSEFAPRPDRAHKELKALLIFSTSYMSSARRRLAYKRFSAVSDIFAAYKRKIALAGVVVDAIQHESTCPSEDEDTSCEDNKDGDADREPSSCSPDSCHECPPCKPSMAGVAISGRNVKSASLILESNALDQCEADLMDFKQSLDFDADVVTEKKKTIGFLFTCSGRGQAMFNRANLETGVINKVFPNVYFTGIYGDGEFGENHWPKFHEDDSRRVLVTEDRQTNFWHFYTNVIALIHVEQE